MTKIQGPLDDSVQLTAMPGDDDDYFHSPSDEARIIPRGGGSDTEPGSPGDDDPAPLGSHSDAAKKKLHRAYLAVVVLTIINLLNYMDRFTIAGVLGRIKKYYNITENYQAGLLQTSFIGSYMILSPIFGYLGDRYNRKLIMIFGISLWSSITLAGSFVPGDKFWLFLLLRGLVGIGEASYSTIAPTLLADLFAKDMRTKMLSIFYFAIPVGSGLGYIVGSNVAALTHQWQWALRVTPVLGLLCIILIIIIIKEPPRGAAEGGTHLGSTSYLKDLEYLVKNKSFMLSSFGVTCVAFGTGALAFWAPLFMELSVRVQGNTPNQVALIFGALTCLAGVLGVVGGAETARRLRHRFKTADPLVCAVGLLVSAPLLFIALVVAGMCTPLTWVLIFLGEVSLSLQWAVVADILLYVVVPTRRSTAEAFQIFLCHALGDAGSPYLIGAISDALRQGTDPASQYIALQKSLYITAFVGALGGGFFLFTEIFILEDKAKVEKAIKAGWQSRVFGAITTFQGSDHDEESSDEDLLNPMGNDTPSPINADKRMVTPTAVIT